MTSCQPTKTQRYCQCRRNWPTQQESVSGSKLGALECPRVPGSLGISWLVAESPGRTLPTYVDSSGLVDELAPRVRDKLKEGKSPKPQKQPDGDGMPCVVTNREISIPMVHRALTAELRRSSGRDRDPRLTSHHPRSSPSWQCRGRRREGMKKKDCPSQTGQTRCSEGRQCRGMWLGWCLSTARKICGTESAHQLEMPKFQLS